MGAHINMSYFVYILKSRKNGRHYIGQTQDVNFRLREHNRGSVRSTKANIPYELIQVEEYVSRTEAIQREHFQKSTKGWQELKVIKTMGRGFPEGITSGQIPPFRQTKPHILCGFFCLCHILCYRLINCITLNQS
jgi:putative endonuclease